MYDAFKQENIARYQSLVTLSWIFIAPFLLDLPTQFLSSFCDTVKIVI
jgi:hypothetical protein